MWSLPQIQTLRTVKVLCGSQSAQIQPYFLADLHNISHWIISQVIPEARRDKQAAREGIICYISNFLLHISNLLSESEQRRAKVWSDFLSEMKQSEDDGEEVKR